MRCFELRHIDFAFLLEEKGPQYWGGQVILSLHDQSFGATLGHISLGVLMTARHSESTPPTLSSPLPSIPSHIPVFDSQFKKIAFCLLSQ